MSEQLLIPETVRLLRRQWKPHKERLCEGNGEHPTVIRFHRACSWLQRVEQNSECQDLDVDLLNLWIAFNALYGQWDEERRDPKPDRASWKQFIEQILRLDQSDILSSSLTENRRLVLSLLEDEYLSRYFWQEPGAASAGKARKLKHSAYSWYQEKRWIMILERALDCVYFLRCQLVHGASTYGGKLNRTSLKRCVWMLQKLLPAFLTVWIEHGADEDWGTLCYPPLKATIRISSS